MPLVSDLTKYTTTSPIIASFDFEDIASGVKYLTYYPYTDAATNLILGSFPTSGFGSKIQTQALGEQNYNTTVFNTRRTVNGTVVIDVAYFDYVEGQPFTFILYRVSGGAETQIGTGTWTSGSGVNSVGTITFQATRTVINKGDHLRLDMTITGSISGKIYIDPTDTLGLGVTKLYVPFEVK